MTISTNTQTLEKYGKAAEEILSVLDEFGFTTEKAFDSREFKAKIIAAILDNITPDDVINVEAIEEQEPSEEDIQNLLDELKDEGKPQNIYKEYVCPSCGNLVR